jgi:transposase
LIIQKKKVNVLECKKSVPLYDEREERVWRHLDSCEYQTYLHCRMSRSNCSEHGIKTMEIPWSSAQSRFTILFERFAIELLQAVPRSISKSNAPQALVVAAPARAEKNGKTL